MRAHTNTHTHTNTSIFPSVLMLVNHLPWRYPSGEVWKVQAGSSPSHVVIVCVTPCCWPPRTPDPSSFAVLHDSSSETEYVILLPVWRYKRTIVLEEFVGWHYDTCVPWARPLACRHSNGCSDKHNPWYDCPHCQLPSSFLHLSGSPDEVHLHIYTICEHVTRAGITHREQTPTEITIRKATWYTTHETAEKTNLHWGWTRICTLSHFPTAAGRRSKNAQFTSVSEHNLTHLMLLFSGRFRHLISTFLLHL